MVPLGYVSRDKKLFIETLQHVAALIATSPWKRSENATLRPDRVQTYCFEKPSGAEASATFNAGAPFRSRSEHQMRNTVTDDSEEVTTRAADVEDMRRRSEEIRVHRLMDDVRYWRERAEVIRTEAEFTDKSIVRATLLDTANGYETLASQIEERLGQMVKAQRS
jgi:hypothetical protein